MASVCSPTSAANRVPNKAGPSLGAAGRPSHVGGGSPGQSALPPPQRLLPHKITESGTPARVRPTQSRWLDNLLSLYLKGWLEIPVARHVAGNPTPGIPAPRRSCILRAAV